MHTQNLTPSRSRAWSRILLVTLLASIIDIAAGWALSRLPLSPGARVVVALAPLPGNVVLLALILKAIRTLDDFQKRVHFEAVVVAFLATGLAVFVYGYLQKARAVGPLNVGFVWSFMLVTYAAGYAIAAKHYE
ncbi:MAG TPA: hypothetical protein VE007_11815 [Thermoanaerobaculia bacterium]|nr:hypothetical protein [Thermoanaerobaculia bacterium]